MIIDTKEFQEYVDFHKKVNACDLEDLVISHNGKEEKLPDWFCEYWKSIGLNNMVALKNYPAAVEDIRQQIIQSEMSTEDILKK